MRLDRAQAKTLRDCFEEATAAIYLARASLDSNGERNPMINELLLVEAVDACAGLLNDLSGANITERARMLASEPIEDVLIRENGAVAA